MDIIEKKLLTAIVIVFVIWAVSTAFLVDLISQHGLKNIVDLIWFGQGK